MATIDGATGTVETREVDASLVTLTHVIYALHAASLVIGVVTAVTIISAFLFGVPSIIAVILNYVRRSDVRGTYLDSHFGWQIRTFWFAALWAVIGIFLWAALAIVVIGFIIGPLILFADGIWVAYRVIRGWLTLKDHRPMSG